MKMRIQALLPKFDNLKVTPIRVVTLICVLFPLLILGIVLYGSSNALTQPRNPGEFWAAVSAVAAVLYVGVTLGVGIVAWYGLRSLRLAREDMVTRAVREAKALGISRGEEFSRMLRGEHKTIQAELFAAKVPSFLPNIGNRVAMFEDINRNYAEAKVWWRGVPDSTHDRIIYFLNDLEAWAMSFTNGLADSDVVFGPIAPTYCSIIMQYSPWIIICRKEQFEKFYPNLRSLFQAWRARLDAADSGSQTEAALRAARAAELRRAEHQLPPIIGTKVDL